MQCLQRSYGNTLRIVIYCSESSNPVNLAHHAKSRFNIDVKPAFEVIPLSNRDLLDPANYPRFTMIRQAWASVQVASRAFTQLVPEVWIDTTGWAFPYPIARMLGAIVISYTHYPTISTDMLDKVKRRDSSFNNSDNVSSSSLRSFIKLMYYRIFAVVYGICGGFSTVSMVNSSWTKGHIAALWWSLNDHILVYPPCDTKALQELPLDRRLKKILILSIAQFRPEKNHEIQLRALADLRRKASIIEDEVLAGLMLQAKLVLAGGCRGPQDQKRVDKLKQLADELHLDSNTVEFRLNVPFSELQNLLSNAIAGIHSMENEHFGISVVEYMAAGAIPIAHNSGGPQGDIVVPQEYNGRMERTGYLCKTIDQYSEAIIDILRMEPTDRLSMSGAARLHATKFSDEQFQLHFKSAVDHVFRKMI